MPGLLDEYIERLRGGDIKTFLTYQDALIKNMANCRPSNWHWQPCMNSFWRIICKERI
ncbi:Uncharacterised protein [Legionella feeleii]|uniref:Uncharacterized protein n=1 Tax=Legionella feeleii TaxID=453 RepID=A0A2X1QRD4_9GAMM|nr:Uncharacterised protein [Legionella feeleii]